MFTFVKFKGKTSIEKMVKRCGARATPRASWVVQTLLKCNEIKRYSDASFWVLSLPRLTAAGVPARLGGCLAGAQGASGMHATVARARLLESSKKLPPASSGAHSQWTWCGGFRPEYTRVAQLARYDI